ncbi:MAG: 50S ribosomal protein L10 [Patescibacteria group bacterium]
MLTKEQKKQFVKNLRKKLKENKLAIFCNFEGIPTKRQKELKKEFQKIGGELFVVKRRLLQRALAEEKIEMPEITGPTIVGLAADEILPAKIFKKFPQKKEKIEFVSGTLREDKKYEILGKKELRELALLPSEEEILTGFLRILQGPLYNLHFVLSGNMKGLNHILAKIRE